ncbi:hypothetical protein IQ268_14950 [Oculatella sp. LEGE 06141]|uniref:hypothetical protein n=1 Tax=Oculatella sp. LEGE 06141 TaxID=1828648 RepID=UPI001882722C|nr:hypothetical protein [Oculatella sp. LEGE 06141]MBE9179867.1 hypothetical protein [Oculatella sp. LEGE 06141]
MQLGVQAVCQLTSYPDAMAIAHNQTLCEPLLLVDGAFTHRRLVGTADIGHCLKTAAIALIEAQNGWV